MKFDDFVARFEDDDCAEYLKFDRIKSPAHSRPDICAFLMLNELQPGDRDMVCAAEHDEIYLDVDCEKLAEVITHDQITDLIRCGVRYEAADDSLVMFA